MRVAVIAANGQAGRLIVEELVNRGIDTIAISRGENNTVAKKHLKKDIFALTKDDIKDIDVIANAFGVWEEDKLDLHTEVINYLSDLLKESKKRLVVVGGAGSLFIDKEHTTKLSETPDFPDEYKPVANAMGRALDELRKKDIDWTYISPAADFVADGEKSGEIIVVGEEFILNDKGESTISYADYAIAFVDEIEKGNNIKKRISVLAK